MSKEIFPILHFHTREPKTGSDGEDSRKEIEERFNNWEQKKENYNKALFIIATNHDSVSKPFSGTGRFTAEGTEITTKESKYGHAHLNYLSSHINDKVRHAIDGVCESKMQSLKNRLEGLVRYGFEGSYHDCLEYFEKAGYNTGNINNLLLAKYVISKKNNRAQIKQILSVDLEDSRSSAIYFYKIFLHNKGDYKDIAFEKDNTSIGIETGIISDSLGTDDILVFNHPHVTCQSIEKYKKHAMYLVDNFGLTGLEICPTGSPGYIEAAIEMQKNNPDLILVPGNDYHGVNSINPTHGDLFDITTSVSPEVIQMNVHRLKERICPKQQAA